MSTIKMDRATADFLANNLETTKAGKGWEFEKCEECGAYYIKSLGHVCDSSIELDMHDVDEM